MIFNYDSDLHFPSSIFGDVAQRINVNSAIELNPTHECEQLDPALPLLIQLSANEQSLWFLQTTFREPIEGKIIYIMKCFMYCYCNGIRSVLLGEFKAKTKFLIAR